MVSCYRCGAPNANYRRTTYIGTSRNRWLSRHSYGLGSRTYYGVRSVCENCARTIDRWNRIKLIFWIVAIAAVIFFLWNRPLSSSKKGSTSQKLGAYQYQGETAIVLSSKGINLRARPSSSAELLLTIPHNEVVGIVDKNGDVETINGKTANWYKVNYRGTTGWVWSNYLKTKEASH